MINKLNDGFHIISYFKPMATSICPTMQEQSNFSLYRVDKPNCGINFAINEIWKLIMLNWFDGKKNICVIIKLKL